MLTVSVSGYEELPRDDKSAVAQQVHYKMTIRRGALRFFFNKKYFQFIIIIIIIIIFKEGRSRVKQC